MAERTHTEQIALLLAVILVTAVLMIVRNAYLFHLGSMICIYIILALGLNLLFGYTGQMSFAQGAFYGIGAYTSAILTTKLGVSFWVSLVPAVILPGLVAAVVGIPTLRLRSHYLAIATVALQLAIYNFFVQASNLTGGSVGLFGIKRPSLFGYTIASDLAFYLLSLFFAAVTYLIICNVTTSRIGRALRAVREDEFAARSLGVNTLYYKVIAFSICAMCAGLAGALYSELNVFVSPETFSIDCSNVIVAMIVVGGLGTNLGAVLGATVLGIVPEFLYSAGDLQFMIYGALIVLVIVLAPTGVAGILQRALVSASERKNKTAAGAEEGQWC